MKGGSDRDISSFANHLASQKAEVKYKIKACWQSHSKAPVRSSGMGQRVPVILWNVLQPGLLGTALSSCPGCHTSWPFNSSFGDYKWGYTFFPSSILCSVGQIKAINLNTFNTTVTENVLQKTINNIPCKYLAVLLEFVSGYLAAFCKKNNVYLQKVEPLVGAGSWWAEGMVKSKHFQLVISLLRKLPMT